MGEEPRIELRWALTQKDVLNAELGVQKHLPLGKALLQAERMLKGSYVRVILVKEGV